MREKLKSILSHWGFIENLDVKAEDISYEPNRESHIWTINEDYLLKMTYTKEEMVNNICFLMKYSMLFLLKKLSIHLECHLIALFLSLVLIQKCYLLRYQQIIN